MYYLYMLPRQYSATIFKELMNIFQIVWKLKECCLPEINTPMPVQKWIQQSTLYFLNNIISYTDIRIHYHTIWKGTLDLPVKLNEDQDIIKVCISNQTEMNIDVEPSLYGFEIKKIEHINVFFLLFKGPNDYNLRVGDIIVSFGTYDFDIVLSTNSIDNLKNILSQHYSPVSLLLIIKKTNERYTPLSLFSLAAITYELKFSMQSLVTFDETRIFDPFFPDVYYYIIIRKMYFIIYQVYVIFLHIKMIFVI